MKINYNNFWVKVTVITNPRYRYSLEISQRIGCNLYFEMGTLPCLFYYQDRYQNVVIPPFVRNLKVWVLFCILLFLWIKNGFSIH